MSFTKLLAALTIAAGLTAVSAASQASDRHRIECGSTGELTRLDRGLPKLSERLAHGEEITILAIGSSSTEGVGATRVELNYPNRLTVELHALLPKAKLRVLNRGIGGQDAKQMLARMARDLQAEKPDIVLWQVGTNALLSETGIDPQKPLIREGVSMIRASGADAVLIDPQYAPKVLRDPDARPMVALLAKVADELGVSVFRRFALMQHWHEVREIAFNDMLSPDLFHMNDWSYGCLARNLAASLVEKVTPPPASEHAREIARNPAPVGNVAVTPAAHSR
jgi:lysophospholipase L1-like esterase